MLCAGILGILSSGGEAVASLVVLKFVVVHHCYYLLCSFVILIVSYNTLFVNSFFYLFILSSYLVNTCTTSQCLAFTDTPLMVMY
jgi:hypothetical protein